MHFMLHVPLQQTIYNNNILGIEYQAMTIKDNVDAKDGGAQMKLFIEAAETINKMMKQVSYFICN